MDFENLWAPWRLTYLQGMAASEAGAGTAAASGPSSSAGCFLCDACAAANDPAAAASRLVLHVDSRGVILLNRYPYANGHLLVAPLQHAGDLLDLDSTGRASLMELTALAERALRLAMNPQGVNVGMNLGKAAGAGVPGHLHVHVVPRWAGDTNFMHVVGHVRVIPQALEHSYQLLQSTIQKLLHEHTPA